jgi:hypothetical protein
MAEDTCACVTRQRTLKSFGKWLYVCVQLRRSLADWMIRTDRERLNKFSKVRYRQRYILL